MILRLCLCFFVLVLPAQSSDKITIFAASSLTNVLGEITQKFNTISPEVDVRISYASSGVLARQIEQGAPADVFISANQDWMTYLQDRDVVKTDMVRPLLSNELVVVTRKENASKPWMELLCSGKFAMGDPVHVPAGIYAEEALKSAGVWSEVRHNAVFGENVRISLRLVAKGEVDAAIVYNSDALLEKELVVAHRFGATKHSGIIYPLAILKSKKAALSFVNFLVSEEAMDIFREAGFSATKPEKIGKPNG